MTCQFAFDDGAYVLGALTPAERAAFEHHLPECRGCREAVAALAVLPGLLGRLDPSTAVTIDSNGVPIAAPSSLLPRVLAAAALQRRRERHIRRWRRSGAALVAASLVAVVGFGVHVVDQRPDSRLVSMQPVAVKLPVSAEVGLMPTTGGTKIEMICRYEHGYPGTWIVRLMVIPDSGVAEQVGTWTAVGGQEITFSAITHFTPDAIARLELWGENGTPLLTLST
jgi:hypothetical protein